MAINDLPDTENADGTADWEHRIEQLWGTFGQKEPRAFIAEIALLVSERPDTAISLFELASAHDSAGFEQEAEPLYRQSIVIGLTGLRRRRAAIQLASTLRNLGHVDESVQILEAERMRVSDDLDDAVAAFLALSWIDQGREREAAGLALSTLAPHLARYNRSLANYSAEFAQTNDARKSPA